MTPEDIASARTMLFVPGARPDRFAKAASAGAGAVVLDLEDAVGEEDKDAARRHVVDWLATGGQAVVRVNAAGTAWHDDDVAMLAGLRAAVMVPKAEDPGVLAELAGKLPGAPLIPLVETAGGVLRAREVCGVGGVVRPAFGSVDLAAQLGIDHTDRQALLHARSSLVLAAAAAGVAAPLDGVTTSVADADLLTADTLHAVELGFTGKLCIHPRQLDTARSGFEPSSEAVEWAVEVLSAAKEGAVAVVGGQMIDKPVVDRARRILNRVAGS